MERNHAATEQPVAKLRNSINKKQIIGMILYAVIIIICILAKDTETLTAAGLRSMLVFLATIISLICGVMPMGLSCALSLAILSLMGVFGSLAAALSSSNMMMFVFGVGAFSITYALRCTTLPMRISAWIIRVTKGNSKFIVLVFMLTSGIIASFLNNLNTIICLLGVCLMVVQLQCGENDEMKGKSNLAKCIMIGVVIGAGVGGCATPIGGGANLICASTLVGATGHEITFAAWSCIGYPIAIIGIILCWLILTAVYKPEPLSNAVSELPIKIHTDIGPMNRKDSFTLIVFLVTAVLWFSTTWLTFLNTSMIAVAAAIVLLLPGIGVITWKDLKDNLPWDTLMLIAFIGAIVKAITSTDAATWMVNTITPITGGLSGALLIFALCIFGLLIHVPIPSGSAMASLLCLPYIMLMQANGTVNPALAPIIVSFACGTALILPFDILVMLTYNYGYYTSKEFTKVGVICAIVLSALFTALSIPLANLVIH